MLQPIVKVGDLGMAAKLNGNQMIEKVAGTVAFMAPEVLLGEPSNFKADVWSLGVILHHLTCKKLPFSGPDRDSTQAEILTKELNLEGPLYANISS